MSFNKFMKNTIATCMTISILVSGMSVLAQDLECTISVNIDIENKMIHFNGNCPAQREHELSYVIVYPNTPNDYTFDEITSFNAKIAVVCAGVITLNRQNGFAFSESCKMPDNAPTGWYQIWFASNEIELKTELQVIKKYYIGDSDIQNIIKAFQKATTANIEEMFNYYVNTEPVLTNIDLEQTDFLAYKTDVFALVAGKIASCTTLLEVTNLFKQSVVIAKVNHTKSGEVITYLKENNNVFNLNLEGDYLTYALTSSDLDDYIVAYRNGLNSGEFSDITQIGEAYKYALAFGIVNKLGVANRSDFPTILEKYNNIFGLDLTKSKYTKNKSQIYSAFMGKGIDTVSAIESAYANWLGESNGSNDKGGSSKSSNSTASAVSTIVREQQNTDEVTKVKGLLDIDSVSWAKNDIEALYKKGIVSGDADGYFYPNSYAKREEVVKIIVEAFNVGDNGGDIYFNDVDKNQWYYRYIAAAFNNELAKGLDESTFGINTQISRADTATLIYRVIKKMEIHLIEKNDDVEFADENLIPDYALESIKVLQKVGIINGVGENTFNPYGLATKAEIAKMINSVLSALQ